MDNFIGYLTLKTKIDTKDFTKEISYVQDRIDDLKATLEIEEKNPGFLAPSTIRETEVEIEKLERKLWSLQKQQSKANMSGFAQIKQHFEDGEKSLIRLIKRMSKYVLAVFGIRSAFMAVRNAINVISQNDPQLKADIDYMKNALAYAIEPIIRKIVEWAKKLMLYIGYIVEAFTGKNIWENANKSLKGANKEAKKLQKTLAGFDEINVLNEQQDTGAGGGSATPSFDLTKGGKMPGWIEWIKENKDTIIASIKEIGAVIAAAGIGAFILQFADREKLVKTLTTNIGKLKDKIADLWTFITTNFTTIAGIALILTGIVVTIQSLIAYMNDPSWSNFGNILIGIGLAVAGVGIAFLGWPVAVAGAIVVVLGLLAKFWDKIEVFLDNIIKILDEFGITAMDWLTEHFGIVGTLLGAFVLTITDTLKHIVNVIKDVFGGILRFVRAFIDGIIQMFKVDLWSGLTTILKGIANLFIDTFNILIDLLNLITTPVRSLIVALGKVAGKSWTMETIQIPKIKRLATGGIVDIPKSGARVGNAVVGEAGAEGVLPLTDEATMTRLGQEIAKWIPINLNITNELDGRILSNRLETIRQNNSFSRNGG